MGRICYTVGGAEDDTNVPCNPNAEFSACCRIGESCIGESLCFSTTGYLYSGACTDSSWQAPECSAHCRNTINITPCDVADHGHQGTFACAPPGGTPQRNCLLNFTLPADFAQMLVVNVTGSAAASSMSIRPHAETPSSTSSQVPSTETSPSTTAPLSSDVSRAITVAVSSTTNNSPTASSHVATSKTYSKSTTIIAAVGVPLGLLLMAVFLYFFLLERRERRRLEQQVAALSIQSSPTRHQISPPLLREQSRRSEIPELPGDRGVELPVDRQTPELY